MGDGSEGSILFPTAYNFEQNLHGTDNLAFPDIAAISTSGKDIHVVGSSGLCMDAGFGGDDPGDIYMHSCLDNDNQQYSFDSSTLQIKHTSSSTGTRCLDYDPGSDNVYLNENCFAGLNQKWRFNPLTLEMSTFSDNKCLDWNAGGNDNVTMHDCTGNKNQVSIVMSSSVIVARKILTLLFETTAMERSQNLVPRYQHEHDAPSPSCF